MPDENTTPATTVTDPEINGELYKREFLLHFIDSSFNGSTVSYDPICEDLEEYKIDMNAEVETKKNIRGKNITRVKKYEPQSTVEPYYAREGSALAAKLLDIINNRKTGNALKTTVVDVMVDINGTVESAYREDVVVVPQSLGGDTEGVGIPYEIHYNGNRTEGSFNLATRAFTPAS